MSTECKHGTTQGERWAYPDGSCVVCGDVFEEVTIVDLHSAAAFAEDTLVNVI